MRNAWRSVRSADGMTAMPAFSHRQEGARRPEVHVTPMPDRHRSSGKLSIGRPGAATATVCNTPRAIVDRLHGEVVKALAAAGVRARLEALGVDSMDMSPAGQDTFVQRQIAADAALARAAGIKPH
jgi:hypothetical protein